jgi:hypothetical protein
VRALTWLGAVCVAQVSHEDADGGAGAAEDAPVSAAPQGALPPPSGAAEEEEEEAEGEGSAGALFRTLRTHQRCAPDTAPDNAGGVLGFEAAAVTAGLAAGGFIAWRRRRAAAAAAQRAGLPRAPDFGPGSCF